MVCYDEAEFCELAGSYLLNKLSNVVDKKFIVIYIFFVLKILRAICIPNVYKKHETVSCIQKFFIIHLLYIYIYIYIYIYTNLPVNVIVRLPHPQSGDSQGQETFSVPSADKQTRNYDTECSNHHPSLSTLRSKGLSRSKMNWSTLYTNLSVNVIVRLPHPQSGDSQGQEMLLAPSHF